MSITDESPADIGTTTAMAGGEPVPARGTQPADGGAGSTDPSGEAATGTRTDELTDATGAAPPAAGVGSPVTHPRYEIGTRLDVDPRDLVIGANVRTDVEPDKTFIKSIEKFGVLHAIRVYQDEPGHLLVEDGQCRTNVAVTVERPTVPIEIIAPPANADRIYQQLTQNDDRTGLTTADRARAYLQLTLEGEKIATIVRTTGRKTDVVKKLVAVGASEVAATAADAYDLDLLQAAVVAEFADDPDAVQLLIGAVTGRGWQSFDHVAQSLRDARASAKARAVALKQCETEGLRVVDDAGPGCIAQELRRLGVEQHDDKGAEDHRTKCPGHAVVLRDRWAAGGREWYAVPVCADPRANGHEVTAASSTDGGPKKKLADMTPEQAEKARAERKAVRDNNVAWQSATTVRRKWLATFADRSRIPAGAETFILGEFLAAPWYLLDSLRAGREILAQVMLPRKEGDRATTADDLVAALTSRVGGSAKRSVVALAALIFSAWENHHGADDRGKGTWRSFSGDDTRVLQQMETWGYPLSEVERLVAHPKPVKTRSRKPAARAVTTPTGEEATDVSPPAQPDDDLAGPADATGPADNDVAPLVTQPGTRTADTADFTADEDQVDDLNAPQPAAVGEQLNPDDVV